MFTLPPVDNRFKSLSVTFPRPVLLPPELEARPASRSPPSSTASVRSMISVPVAEVVPALLPVSPMSAFIPMEMIPLSAIVTVPVPVAWDVPPVSPTSRSLSIRNASTLVAMKFAVPVAIPDLRCQRLSHVEVAPSVEPDA